jgi:DNA-binding NarL/FixJ family response regulator
MRLLIVEDNRRMRRALKNFVADYADEIYECEDGAAAFDCYRKLQPDFVLMDVQMPRCDGIAATREIKREFPQAKILIVTNYDESEMRRAAFDAGASGYVLKENLLPLLDCLENGGSGLSEAKQR